MARYHGPRRMARPRKQVDGYRCETDLVKQTMMLLRYQQNAGRLIAHRLNSGTAFVNSTLKSGEQKQYAIEGQRKGTADILVMIHNRIYPVVFHVVYIECKMPGKSQSEVQKQFQQEVERIGAQYYVIYDAREIMPILQKYGIEIGM